MKCHGTCQHYGDWKMHCEEIRKEKRKESDLRGAHCFNKDRLWKKLGKLYYAR